MDSFTLREAKAKLSLLLDRAASGEEIEIRRGGPKGGRFRLVLVEAEDTLRRPGALKGQIGISEDFDAEDAEITAGFEGR